MPDFDRSLTFLTGAGPVAAGQGWHSITALQAVVLGQVVLSAPLTVEYRWETRWPGGLHVLVLGVHLPDDGLGDTVAAALSVSPQEVPIGLHLQDGTVLTTAGRAELVAADPEASGVSRRMLMEVEASAVVHVARQVSATVVWPETRPPRIFPLRRRALRPLGEVHRVRTRYSERSSFPNFPG